MHSWTEVIPSDMAKARWAPAAALACAMAAIAALSVACCGLGVEAVYLAAVPAFGAWKLIAPGGGLRRPQWRHIAYAALLAAATAAYLAAIGATMPLAKVRWSELPLALYFIASLHAILWFIDRLASASLGWALRIKPSAPASRWRNGLRQAGRSAALLLIGVPVIAAALCTHWVKFDDRTDPQQMCNLQYEPAGFLTADGLRLGGWYIPTLSSNAAVVLAPGRGMGKAACLPYAKILHDLGFSVLLIDLRGEGLSEGHASALGVLEPQDVLAGVNYLRQAHPQASEHVLAMGISHGAAAVLGAAAQSSIIEAVIADSAFPSPASQLADVSEPLGSVGRFLRQATLLAASAQVGCDLQQVQVARDIARIGPRPVLMIHGWQDETVPMQQADELYAHAQDPALLWRVQGAGHANSLAVCGEQYTWMLRNVLRNIRLGLPAFQ